MLGSPQSLLCIPYSVSPFHRRLRNTEYAIHNTQYALESPMFPVLFQYGPLVVYTHDFFTTLGLLAGLLFYYWELRRRDMLGLPIFWISIAAIVGGGIGARLSVAWQH